MVRVEYSVTAVICPTAMVPSRERAPPTPRMTAISAPINSHTTGVMMAKSRLRRIMLLA